MQHSGQAGNLAAKYLAFAHTWMTYLRLNRGGPVPSCRLDRSAKMREAAGLRVSIGRVARNRVREIVHKCGGQGGAREGCMLDRAREDKTGDDETYSVYERRVTALPVKGQLDAGRQDNQQKDPLYWSRSTAASPPVRASSADLDAHCWRPSRRIGHVAEKGCRRVCRGRPPHPIRVGDLSGDFSPHHRLPPWRYRRLHLNRDPVPLPP